MGRAFERDEVNTTQMTAIRPGRKIVYVGIFLALLLAGSHSRAQGQTAVTVGASLAEYDLSGTGWSGTAEAHVDFRVSSWAFLEVGSGAFWYTTQSDKDVLMLLPEVGVRVEAPWRVRAYFAAGVGQTLVLRSDRPNDPTLYAATGLILDLARGWAIRPEVRIRFVDPFVGGIGSYTLGLSKSLGGRGSTEG